MIVDRGIFLFIGNFQSLMLAAVRNSGKELVRRFLNFGFFPIAG